MSAFEVRIEKIVSGGEGLAHHQGRVVFVPGTAPGERHLVESVREKKDYLRARSVECLEPSAARRPPPCPYYQSCGGCALMHLVPEAQLEAKKAVLTEGLARSAPGRTAAGQAGSVGVSVAQETGYRNRLRFHVAVTNRGTVAGFRKRGSHELVDVEHCLLGSSSLNETWRRVRRTLRDSRGLARSLVSVELQESSHQEGSIAARFVVSSSDALSRFDAGFRENLRTEVGLEGLVVSVDRRGPLVRSGRPFVEHQVQGLLLRQSVGSFFQANRFLLGELVRYVLPDDSAAAPDRALDLYSGVGLFALPLARRGARVVGVETETLALADARASAARAGLGPPGVRFLRGDASAYSQRAKLRPDDFVVLDPPRGGLPRALVEALGESPLRSLRYVSCDPPALFRDMRLLGARGFQMEAIALVDLFPNTHHFECVSILSR
jgi:23S rRNA (uracil1939-C5)-methyltransferase